ncbi:carbohydrate ABC transporter permease [Propionicimonas sp.]|uniref:carbohydrate ABC transporter permease n=1 Tax=Propionicimonas sp. TaxID=1955623 RepID=UPI001854956C|nr:carbohydrate ABC transporter permease [Propionicimonas sp.]MBU3977024.1 carbohydrate ABC transporter permease [Actinomycetota bacterium]MBA3020594.1 carbohydrate ABC transporter permease [Propionicimonas sp.]MBU3984964.1 carbohydrate ABC transporter permease [Actinomycetota bacterium]MBU4007079.1 carbohydrate ABC transporter permease [Actinomycetota bacterium]MBU4064832.1 carbohydrate ABC transporter permease [Actinomycetota bacterium]
MTSVATARQLAGPGAARAAARRRQRMEGGTRRPGWIAYTILSVVVLISVTPLYYAFLLSASTAGDIARNPVPSPIPQAHFFENLGRVLNSGIGFWSALGNSVIVSLVTAVSVVFFSTLAGYSFAKLRFRGRNWMLAFVIGTMAVPTQLGVIPLFIVMSNLGWTGKLIGVIVPAMVTAFGVFWMTQYLSEALPYELIEAARVDGCSMIRTFWHVALPAARPAAAMLALFTFVGSWTNFFWPFIVLGSSNPTLPVALQLLQASYFKDMSLIMAGVVLATLPLLALFAFAGRHLVSGIMQGAVKG